MKKIIALMLVCLTVVGILCSCNIADDVNAAGPSTNVSTKPMTPDKVLSPTPAISEDDVSFVSKEDNGPVKETSKAYYIVTAEEREMLATLVYLESSICSTECQRAVASVIFNRLDSEKWRKDMNKDGAITLYDIVYYPNAFSPSYLIEDYKDKTTQECYDAVDYVIQNGPTVPTEVRYFRTKYDFNWDNYANYCVLDNVYFGYFTNWKQGAW